MKIETLAIHAAADPDPATGAISPPIHLSTTFEHGPASEELHGYTYVRDKNPTQDRLEEALTLLEGGEGALVYSSGMGAAITLLLTFDPDSHVIFPEDVYAHVRVAHQQYLPKWNFQSVSWTCKTRRRSTTRFVPIRNWFGLKHRQIRG